MIKGGGAALKSRILLVTVLLVSPASRAMAATCMNKYIAQREGSKYTLTVLTGKISYSEAYELAQAVNNHTAPVPEWVDDKGRTIAKHMGGLKVIRPMPVSCDGKLSGVVLTTVFLSTRTPSGKILIKFDDKNTVELEEQEK